MFNDRVFIGSGVLLFTLALDPHLRLKITHGVPEQIDRPAAQSAGGATFWSQPIKPVVINKYPETGAATFSMTTLLPGSRSRDCAYRVLKERGFPFLSSFKTPGATVDTKQRAAQNTTECALYTC